MGSGGPKSRADRYRYGAGLVAAIAAAAALEAWVTPGAPSTIVIALLAFACTAEVAALLRAAGAEPFSKVSIPLALAVILLHGISHLEQSFAPGSSFARARGLRTAELGLLAYLLFCAACVLRQRTDDAGKVLGAGAIVLAVPTSLLHMTDLRFWGGGPYGTGLGLLLFLVSVSKIGDIAAYIVGSAVGRRKLIPAVSPGKTWEGAFASLVASVGLAAVLGLFGVAGSLTLERTVVAGFVINLASQFGDLTESLLKRSAGAKDSGRWLPQFGGAFDLVDSLFLAAPMFYGFLRLSP